MVLSCSQLNSVGNHPYLWQERAWVHYNCKSSVSPFKVYSRVGLRGPASPELSCLNEFAGVTCDVCCSGHSWGPESELEGWLFVHSPELFIYYPLHSILLLQLILLCLACILKKIVQIHRKISHVSILQLEIPCFTATVLNSMRRKDNFWDRCFSFNTCFCTFCTHPAFLCSPSPLSQKTSDTP